MGSTLDSQSCRRRNQGDVGTKIVMREWCVRQTREAFRLERHSRLSVWFVSYHQDSLLFFVWPAAPRDPHLRHAAAPAAAPFARDIDGFPDGSAAPVVVEPTGWAVATAAAPAFPDT